MTHNKKKWLWSLAIVAALLAALAGAAAMFIPSDEELARMAEQRLAAALDVPVSIGALHWQLFPVLAVVMEDAKTGQTPPITVRKLTATVRFRPLLQHEIDVKVVQVEGAVVPRASLRALGHKRAGELAEGQPGNFHLAPIPLEQLRFSDVTYIGRSGIPALYDGKVAFDDAWRPRTAQLRRPGVQPPATLALTRKGDEDRWDTRIAVGGGTLNGETQLHANAQGMLHLSGQLDGKGVEVAATVAAFNRRPSISGRAFGPMTLSADGANFAQLVGSLHTQTPFTIAPATVLRFDLDKAIRSFGKDHAGQTELDTLSGQMDTQNTADGTVWTFSRLQGKSGSLGGSGDVVLFNGKIDAQATVDLAGGLVGVPFNVSGTLAQPEVHVQKGFVAGAAIGTAILPGIGTIIGAKIGSLFGKKPSPAALGASAPAASPAAARAPQTPPPPAARSHP